MSELMLRDTARAHGSTTLPALFQRRRCRREGAHWKFGCGRDPSSEGRLRGSTWPPSSMSVFGTDYDTPDGTGVRDTSMSTTSSTRIAGLVLPAQGWRPFGCQLWLWSRATPYSTSLKPSVVQRTTTSQWNMSTAVQVTRSGGRGFHPGSDGPGVAAEIRRSRRDRRDGACLGAASRSDGHSDIRDLRRLASGF